MTREISVDLPNFLSALAANDLGQSLIPVMNICFRPYVYSDTVGLPFADHVIKLREMLSIFCV